jgi:hypothetical protein
MDINDAWLNNPYLLSNPMWDEPLAADDNYEYDILNQPKEVEWNPIKTCKCLDCDYDIKNELSKIKADIEGINNNIVTLCNVIKELKLELPKKRNHEEMADFNRLYSRGPYKKRNVRDKHGRIIDVNNL